MEHFIRTEKTFRWARKIHANEKRRIQSKRKDFIFSLLIRLFSILLLLRRTHIVISADAVALRTLHYGRVLNLKSIPLTDGADLMEAHIHVIIPALQLDESMWSREWKANDVCVERKMDFNWFGGRAQ